MEWVERKFFIRDFGLLNLEENWNLREQVGANLDFARRIFRE